MLNKIIIGGRLTADPEISTIPGSGTQVLKMSVAVDRMPGSDKNVTDFIRCEMFGSRVEKLSPYLHKGDPVTVIGSMKVTQSEKEGEKNTWYAVNVDTIDFMGAAINQVITTGRLVATPELKTTTTGKNVTSFNIAVNEKYVQNNEKKEKTTFLTVVAWEKLAEFICRNFEKGGLIAIDNGHWVSRNYEDKNTKAKKTIFEINALSVKMVAQRKKDDAQAQQPNSVSVPESYASSANIADDDYANYIQSDDGDLPF